MEKRRAQRFPINLPVQISVVSGKRVARVTQTSNISSGGVTFPSAKEVKIGGKIEYEITLSAGEMPIRIHCTGKVLRIEPAAEDVEMPFRVTATIDKYKFIRK
jgi:hypothetical protein